MLGIARAALHGQRVLRGGELEGLRDPAQDLVAAPADELGVDAAHGGDGLAARRGATRELDERLVEEDPAARTVHALGFLLAPCRELPQDGELTTLELRGRPDPPVERSGVLLVAGTVLVHLELLPEPVEAPPLLEVRVEAVAKGMEVLDVRQRVRELLRRQRPPCP